MRRVKKQFQQLSVGYMKGKSTLVMGTQFGLTKLSRMHEFGKRTRVTGKTRGRFALMGYPLKKSTKHITIPARPVIGFFWKKKNKEIPRFVEKAFFDIFFSKRNQRLKI